MTTELYPAEQRCPCGTGLTYGECCGRFHRGEATAPTAEALMRSRFTAFAVGHEAYLLETWDLQTRPESLHFDEAIRFYRLDILDTTGGGLFDDTGSVHFRAYYKGAFAGVQEEKSTFKRVNGRWVYSTGETSFE